MNPRYVLVGVALAGAIALASQGCKHDDSTPDAVIHSQVGALREGIRATVTEPARRDPMLALIDRLERESLLCQEQSREFSRRLQELNADYATPDAAFEALALEVRGFRDRQREVLVGIHLEMARLATAEEWPRLVKHELGALRSASTISAAGTGGQP